MASKRGLKASLRFFMANKISLRASQKVLQSRSELELTKGQPEGFEGQLEESCGQQKGSQGQ